MKYKTSVILAIISGILFIISGTVGGPGIWGILINILKDIFPENIAIFLNIILQILNFLGFLGGFTIIAGGILIGIDHKRTGKIIISLGSGSGLIGFIIKHILLAISGSLTLGYLTLALQSPAYWGIILSIIAVWKAKDKEED